MTNLLYSKMTNDFHLLLPIFFLILACFANLILNLLYNHNEVSVKFFRINQIYFFLSLIFTLILTLTLFYLIFNIKPLEISCNSFFNVNKFTLAAQLFVLLTAIIIFLITFNYEFDIGLLDFEVQFLKISVIIGALLLVVSNDFISLFLSLEIQTIPLYILTAFLKNSKKSIESALKYFILSIFSSALLLFGIALIYFVTGLTNFTEIAVFFKTFRAFNSFVFLSIYGFYIKIAILGFVFIVFALLFKLTAAPLHFWVADVYDGAPYNIILIFSTIPKYSVFVVFSVLLYQVFSPFSLIWGYTLLNIGVFSVCVGTIGAFYYNKLTKILAYGGVAHIGFVLIGLAGNTDTSLSVALFYLIIYVISTLGFFAFWLSLTKNNQYYNYVSEFSNLFENSKILAFTFTVILFSQAGIPPLVGFAAKLLVLIDLVKNYHIFYSILIALISTVSAVYYLRIVKAIFFTKLEKPTSIDTISVKFNQYLLLILITSSLIFPIFFLIILL